jgi:hypothetical protein
LGLIIQITVFNDFCNHFGDGLVDLSGNTRLTHDLVWVNLSDATNEPLSEVIKKIVKTDNIHFWKWGINENDSTAPCELMDAGSSVKLDNGILSVFVDKYASYTRDYLNDNNMTMIHMKEYDPESNRLRYAGSKIINKGETLRSVFDNSTCLLEIHYKEDAESEYFYLENDSIFEDVVSDGDTIVYCDGKYRDLLVKLFNDN